MIYTIINIDFSSDTPIYTQLCDQIIIGIASSGLVHGEALPSVRLMAQNIGVHAHTVNKAYLILSREGFITIDRRSGCRIANVIPEAGDSFKNALRQKLLPIVASAAGRHMPVDAFKELCDEIYRSLNQETGG